MIRMRWSITIPMVVKLNTNERVIGNLMPTVDTRRTSELGKKVWIGNKKDTIVPKLKLKRRGICVAIDTSMSSPGVLSLIIWTNHKDLLKKEMNTIHSSGYFPTPTNPSMKTEMIYDQHRQLV